jgi:transcriptional regulator with XRE-family HTH domain
VTTAKGEVMPEQSTSFAERLRSLREAAGLSQYALAKRSAVSKQALSRLELGEREPNWVTVQRLAAALGVSCEAFLDPTVLQSGGQTEELPRRRGRPRKEPAATTEDKPKRPRGRPKKGK